jgi:hypothetical protein
MLLEDTTMVLSGAKDGKRNQTVSCLPAHDIAYFRSPDDVCFATSNLLDRSALEIRKSIR